MAFTPVPFNIFNIFNPSTPPPRPERGVGGYSRSNIFFYDREKRRKDQKMCRNVHFV